MTGDYTVVHLNRQDELTRSIKQRLDKAKAKVVEIKRKGAAAQNGGTASVKTDQASAFRARQE
jgi:hypothetical protein